MKTAAFTIALLMGGAALAQTYPSTTTTAPPEDTAVPAETTMPAESTMQTPTTAPAPMTTAMEQTVQPGNTDPEHDARGIAVISDPATAPAGFNQPAGTTTSVGGPLVDPSAALATQPATESYPPCTREVTDNCVQTYERGRSPQ